MFIAASADSDSDLIIEDSDDNDDMINLDSVGKKKKTLSEIIDK